MYVRYKQQENANNVVKSFRAWNQSILLHVLSDFILDCKNVSMFYFGQRTRDGYLKPKAHVCLVEVNTANVIQ